MTDDEQKELQKAFASIEEIDIHPKAFFWDGRFYRVMPDGSVYVVETENSEG